MSETTGELPLEEPSKGGKKPAEFNTPQVNAMIERKYAENGEYIVLFDCPDVVGTKQERRCDAVALGMWSRTGYKIHGFEVIDEAMEIEKKRLEAQYASRNKDYYENMYIALKKRVDDAEAASGLQLEGWRFGDPAQVGKLAGALHALVGRYDAPEGKLKQHIQAYADLATRTQSVLDELEKHEWTKST